MSTLGEALKGVKQLLLIQKQVEDLEQASEVQANALRDLAKDVIEIDKRVVRIETMVEMAGGSAARAAPKLPRK
jgi:hypothetical protein